MQPSNTTVSNILNDIKSFNDEIEQTLLIGEKVGLIYTASYTFNKLKGLVTPDYLTDEEFDWLNAVGSEWNSTMAQYAKSAIKTDTSESAEDIESALKDAIDDLMNNLDDDFKQDRGGFDGGDGIW